MSKSFAPMLGCRDSAHTFEDKVQLPVYVSPKLDGIRNVQVGGQGLSRKLLQIPNKVIRACLSAPEFEGLDGEIIVGEPYAENVYNRTQSLYASHDKKDDFCLYVFDDFTDPTLPYMDRRYVFMDRVHTLQALTGRVSKQLDMDFRIRPVHSDLCGTWEQVREKEEFFLSAGFEGAILRHPDMPYKFGRSTAREQGMLKLKRFTDSEAVIIGFEELMHNTNEQTRDELGNAKRSSAADGLVGGDTLGALSVRDIVSEVEFSIGMFKGLTAADKKQLWERRNQLFGHVVKYSYFPVGNIEKPRHPKFTGFRHPIDM